MLDIERWRRGADFAYSILYEGPFEILLRQSMPVHDEFMIPASVAVFSGRMGQMFDRPGSPYHMIHRHLSHEELRELVDRGWAVSSQGVDAHPPTADAVGRMAASRAVIEEVVGRRVSLFVLTSPKWEIVPAAAMGAQSGYLGMFSLLDHLNLPDDELYCLGRHPLMEEGPPPWRRQFDPFERLLFARDQGAWVVDSLSHVCSEPILRGRELTFASLVRRFKKLREVGEGRVWCATPEEVVDYILTRRATRITPGKGHVRGNEYVLSVRGLSPSVRNRRLTFRASGLKGPVDMSKVVRNLTDRVDIRPVAVEDDAVRFEVEVVDGLRLQLPDA